MNRRIILSQRFIHHFQTRIFPHESLVAAYISSVDAFRTDPTVVGDHTLRGPLAGRRAFWMNNDYRVVYQAQGDDLLFLDIGTHAQVYQH